MCREEADHSARVCRVGESRNSVAGSFDAVEMVSSHRHRVP